jgi:D-alanyl-D-alanine carboxypeptidase/D-alanyl-D-alanine-endopeptidase (penicillin-binding protein 4)
VIGRNGTLYRRMRGTAAQDRCHAKTGTLRDVSTLAGYCTTVGGRRVAFAFLMNATTTWRSHPLQDAMTAALARLD